MKAIVYEGAEKLSYKEIAKPEPVDGWSLIRIAYAGICGTDLNIYAGTHPRAKAPLVPGHEFAGVLETDTAALPKGTHVTVYPLLSCNQCRPCLEGNAHVCNTLGLLGIDRDGGMAEYALVPTNSLIALPNGVSDKLGAFIEPVAVAVHAIRESGYLSGDNAIVFGGGTIGLTTALALRAFGNQNVVLVEKDEKRAEIAAKLGFTVLSPEAGVLKKAVEEHTGGNGFDFVFDCAGVQPVANVLLDMVKVRGTILIIAAYKKPAELPLIQGMFKEARIQFVRVYRKKDFEIAARLVCAEPDFEKVITHVVPASQPQKGFDLLTTPGTGAVKVVFDFREGNV